jgi:hypothetical protein
MPRHHRTNGDWEELASQPAPAEKRVAVRQVVIGVVIAAAILAPGLAWSVQHHGHWV